MTFFAEMADVADELLDEFGVAVTVRYVTAGAYDPATGSAAVTTTDTATVAYVDDYADREIDGTNILRGDRRLYISAVGVVKPGPSDKVLIASVEYAVVNAKAIPGAGTASLFDVQVRR